MNEKAISNEEIIAALLNAGTIKGAAEAVGAAPRTIYDRMKDSEFRAAYSAAKSDIIRAAVVRINARISDAIDTITEIMTDANNPPTVRLQAAQSVLAQATRLADKLNAGESDSCIFRDMAK